MLPFTSLNGATSAVAGEVHDLEGVLAHHRMEVTIAGYAGSGSITVRLEGSLDGVNWFPVADATSSALSQVSAGQDGSWSVPYFQSGGNLAESVAFPARYVRANITSYPGTVTGGSVTALVASC